MKEKDAMVDNKNHPLIIYVEKEDKSYGPVISGALASGEHLDDFFFKKRNIQNDLMNRLINGEITPILYYMTINEISAAELAVRVGISRSKLKKHLIPKYFRNIRLSLLERYAEVFDVPVANLLQMILVRDEKHGEGYKAISFMDGAPERISVIQDETVNPILSVMKIGEVK